MFENLMNTNELGQVLGVKEGWIRENRESMNIPHYKLGRKYFYRLSEIEEWLKSHQGL
jgi:excisionase family DNA binding protein